MTGDVPGLSRQQRWERAAYWPLTLAALLFLAAYAWPILDPHLSDGWLTACTVTSWAVWALFAIDYAARLALAPRRAAFVRTNVFDLAAVALPLLRPLRLLRLVRVLAALNRTASGSLRGRIATYVVGASALVLFVASLTALDTERDAPNATITTFGDAVWWAFTTMTTVGYGDTFPVTTLGRVTAVGLMLSGIALLGVVTATLASWLVERVVEVEESQVAGRLDLETLTAEVSALRRELRDRPAAE